MPERSYPGMGMIEIFAFFALFKLTDFFSVPFKYCSIPATFSMFVVKMD
jgi:hypothetical protein